MRGRYLVSAAFLTALATGPQFAQDQSTLKAEQRIAGEVRHALTRLTYFTVFDNLAYKVNGYTVTLEGQATKPILKSDAENAVKKIEGVETVVNNIEVLPLSPNDDRIRKAVYRAVFRQAGLGKYKLGTVPSIHIIVNSGRVTLTGAVDNAGDKTRAGIAANGVPGVFSVTNDLLVSP
jgi:hyperosmotically inducible protein